MTEEDLLDITQYGKVIKEYEGVGDINWIDGQSNECTLKCGQLLRGDIICKCLVRDLSVGDALINLKPIINITGKTDSGDAFTLTHCRIAFYSLPGPFDITILSQELAIEKNIDIKINEIKFYLINCSFNKPIYLEIDSYDVSIESLNDHRERMHYLKVTYDVAITSILTFKTSGHEKSNTEIINEVREIATNICYLLSFAEGHKISWHYYDVINKKGELISSYLKKTRKITPFNSWWTIFPDYDIDSFLSQCYNNFINHKQEYNIFEVLDQFLNSISETNFLELRGLGLVALLDHVTKLKYPKLTDLPSKLENLATHLKLDITRDEFDEFNDIRNNLAHKSRFFDLHEPTRIKDGKVVRINERTILQQYYFVLSVTQRILLGILRYEGYYFDRRYFIPNTWTSENVSGRVRMAYKK
jgi:hypothetical protein